MGDDDDDTIKMDHCPMFNGVHASFQKWWIRFEIYSITNGFDDVGKQKSSLT